MAWTWSRLPTFRSGQIKYTIWLKEQWQKIEVVTDRENNVLSNIEWYTVKKVSEIFHHWEILVEVDYDTYSLINSWYKSTLQETNKRVDLLLKGLYYWNKKEENAA